MRPLPTFEIQNWVYAVKTPSLVKRKTDKATQNASQKPVLKKAAPFGVVPMRKRTVTVDGKGIHSVVPINRITLAKTSKKSN